MQVIASSKNNKNKISRTQWIVYCIVTLIISGACIAFLLTGGGQYAILLLFLYLVLFAIMIFRDMQNRNTPFIAFTDQGKLFIDFMQMEERFNNMSASRFIEKKYCFKLQQITGYKLHSFFKTAPSIIELKIDESPHGILDVIIPLDSLSKKEAQKFITFIEQLLPRHEQPNAGLLHE